MYCTNCGAQIEENSANSFCPNCGNAIAETKPPTQKSSENTTRAMINYYELRRKSEEHAGTAAELTSQAEARKKTLRHCTIAGIIFAILGMSSGTPNEPGPVLAILGFLTPYGFAPMWHWVQEHGFFIVFNWILLLIAAVLAFFTSIVIAPIYIVRSIRLIKANSSLAKQEQSIADRYAAEAIG